MFITLPWQSGKKDNTCQLICQNKHFKIFLVGINNCEIFDLINITRFLVQHVSVSVSDT